MTRQVEMICKNCRFWQGGWCYWVPMIVMREDTAPVCMHVQYRKDAE